MRTRVLVAASITAVLLLSLATIASASDAATDKDLATVRRATAAYHNVERAVADPTVPNILVYAPQPNERLRARGGRVRLLVTRLPVRRGP